MAQKIETLATGAVNPVVDTRMDKLPPRALLRAGQVLKAGMKYEQDRPDNWRGVPPEEHLNHALRHVMLHAAGDTSEDHVGHVIGRILMWGELTLCATADPA